MEQGFLPVSYFCPMVDDAVYYAATGGEGDLQRREESWELENGLPPREEYGAETWLMLEHLYPDGERPVILVVEIDVGDFERGRPDPGATNGICFDDPLPASAVVSIHEVDWGMVDREGYDPLPSDWRAPGGTGGKSPR